MSVDNLAHRKIKILHVVQDDRKFFDPVLSLFESDSRLENQCVLVVDKESDAFKSIPKTDRITPLWTKRQMVAYFTNGTYDVIYFHSFCPNMWKILKYVPKDKVVIWWAWGMDIYCDNEKKTSMLIPIKLYMRGTYRCLLKNYGITYCLKLLAKYIIRPFYLLEKHRTLARIDYFQPVIFDDYVLMKKHNKSLKAKEFYYPNSLGVLGQNDIEGKKAEGMVLFGNSASYTNNHLDVWHQIEKYISASQRVVIPLNYGDKAYADIVSKFVSGDNIEVLKDFMAPDSYFKMLDNCSYFVSGILRQQAMGNISYCISHGIKIFLYKDSVVYKYLKRLGVEVFAIEDIDKNSFSTPLSREVAIQNNIAYKKELDRRNRIFEEFISFVSR